MLTHIGDGQTGSTYLACNASGKLTATKLYGPRRPTAAVDDDREACMQKLLEEMRTKCTTELDRWKLLLKQYPTYSCVLDVIPVLVMPYGHEIASKRDREAALFEIRGELKRYAKAGSKYAKADLRWRHVLRDFQEKIFLADLESLESFAKETSEITKETIDNVVA
jgi:hypothetical protein